MGGGGFDGYFGEQGLPAGIQECLENFANDALTIVAGKLLRNGTARMVKANWRRRVQHRCWCNLNAWPRSPWRVGETKVLSCIPH